MPPDNTAAAVVPESRTPTLGDLFDSHGQSLMRKIRVAMPARVESYDAAKQTVAVKPLLKDISDQEDGSLQIDSLPVINNVPVVFPGGGGFRTTFPIKAGDIVLLVFSDRSLDIWKSKGGETDPILFQRHHINDAIAIPGLHDQTVNWQTAATDRQTLGFDSGPLIHLKQAVIELGNAATQGVGLGDAIKTFADAVVTWANSHVHTSAAPGSPTTPSTTSLGAAPTMASTKAKVTP